MKERTPLGQEGPDGTPLERPDGARTERPTAAGPPDGSTPCGEAEAGAWTPGAERPRTDLGELARFAATGGTPRTRSTAESTSEENSGVIDLRALAASAAEGAAPALTPGRPGPLVDASRAEAAGPPSAGSARVPSKRREAAWLALTGLLAASAAVGGVFFGRAHSDTGSRAATAASQPLPRLVSDSTALVTGGTPTPADLHATSPPTGPSESAAVAAAPSSRSAISTPSSASSPSSLVEAPLARKKHGGDDHRPPGPALDMVPGGDSDLQSLMRRAVGSAAPRGATGGASDSPVREPPSAAGAPFKPSLGAVQGAVGTALPTARACLGPDDPVDRATLTFRSDGSVENVVVTGFAAGTPAEACIRRALGAARLAPFAAPTFTWTTTVRPP